MNHARELELRVRALGAVFDETVNEATRSIYRDAVDLSPAGEEWCDVPYGDGSRHRLDVYLPGGVPRGAVVFVHGGGFVGGDKNADGVFYVNVGRWLARNGWTAVLPNYRLAPDAGWPAGARDVQAVIEWIGMHEERLAPRGGPIAVWGQSAGACHVASWAFDASARGTPGALASAVLLMSGYYLAEAPLSRGQRAYFGDDTVQALDRSPLKHVSALGMPMWLSVAELDPPHIAQHTWTLARAVTFANGRSPAFCSFGGHNHVSTVQSLGSRHEDVGIEILRFLDGVAKEGG